MTKWKLGLVAASLLVVGVGVATKAQAWTCTFWDPWGQCVSYRPDTPPGMIDCTGNTTCNSGAGEVLYFTGQNGTGWCAKTQGAAEIASFANFNDLVRSVKNCSGKMVDAYEHINYGGYHGTFGDAGNTPQNLNSDLDLKISSSKRRP